MIDALMHTRRIFLEDGMLSCGLVALPETEQGPVFWQICSGVIETEPLDKDLDAGSAFAHFLGEGVADDDVYTESFPTAIGTGVGLISTTQVFGDGSVSLPLPDTSAYSTEPHAEVTLGLAVALAMPPGGGRGLAVVGQCLDVEQVRELACIVALMAGKSTIDVYTQDRKAASA